MKRILTFEHMCFGVLCLVSVFGYSKGMTDPYIVPKWCFTCLVLLFGIIILLVKCSFGKALYWDVLVCSYIIGGICVFQSLYGIAQWFQIILLQHNCKVVGSFDNSAGFAACLCSGFPFVLLCIKAMKGQKQRIVMGLLNFIFVLSLLVSASRSGLIAITVIISIVLYKYIHIRKKRKIGLFICTLFLFLVGSYFLKKDSADGRLLIWKCSWEMIKEAPLGGHGVDSFRKYYMDYQSTYFERNPNSKFAILADNVQSPFNEYLSIVLNFGFLGLLALLVILGLLFYCYYKKPKLEKKIAMLSILSISVFSIFSYPFTYPFVWVIIFFCIYIIIKDIFRFRMAAFYRNILRGIVLIVCFLFLHSLCRRIKAEYQWCEASRLYNISDFEKLLPILGKDPYFLYNYAVMLYSTNHQEESLEVALLCSKQWTDYDLELLLGDIYVYKKEYALAEFYYKKAAYMCPCRFIPLYKLTRWRN
ncbi:O-antigen ligase [Bacteroides ovatus]|uniref:O-antigen ligase n=1 Tax=Bacteroides ovatus TaxID=28116 RepID=A0A1G6GCE2_BACOV|nr:O-antigen ligase family protein [Bacteroides ovatus]SDB79667.1 O-antigen ligase [Bacteroides ovatus]